MNVGGLGDDKFLQRLQKTVNAIVPEDFVASANFKAPKPPASSAADESMVDSRDAASGRDGADGAASSDGVDGRDGKAHR